jgi:hypothetical protein
MGDKERYSSNMNESKTHGDSRSRRSSLGVSEHYDPLMMSVLTDDSNTSN